MRQREALVAILVLLIATAVLMPMSMHYTRQGFRGCTINLKNIGTACEMMSTDSTGRFPVTLTRLTPHYLKVIPTCPAAGTDTYSPSFASSSNPDAYTVSCRREHHADAGFGRNPPGYTSREGLDFGEGLVEVRTRTRRQCLGRTRLEVLAYLRRNGIEVTQDADGGIWGDEPCTLAVAQSIGYYFTFGDGYGCTEVGVGYRIDTGP